MCYDPSYVGKVESGGARPTEDVAKRADQTLNAGGAIVRRWKEYDLAARWAVRQDHHVDEPMPSSRCRSAPLAWSSSTTMRSCATPTAAATRPSVDASAMSAASP